MIAHAAVAAGGFIACLLPAACTPEPPAIAPCEGTHVIVTWDAPVGCDLTPPQELHLDYTGTTPEFAATDCANHGGTLIGERCENVDY